MKVMKSKEEVLSFLRTRINSDLWWFVNCIAGEEAMRKHEEEVRSKFMKNIQKKWEQFSNLPCFVSPFGSSYCPSLQTYLRPLGL